MPPSLPAERRRCDPGLPTSAGGSAPLLTLGSLMAAAAAAAREHIHPPGARQRRPDGRAGHSRSRDFDHLHRRTGLRQHLQQARRSRREQRVHRCAGDEVDPERPDDVDLRARRQRDLPERREVHVRGRQVHLRAHPGPRDGELLRAAVRRHRQRRDAVATQVVFKLKTPFGPFLSNLANNGEIVNQKAIEAADPARKPVGTGPFEFVEWVQGDHITLKKNPTISKPDSRISIGSSSSSCWSTRAGSNAWRSGDLDWVDAIPLQQLATLRPGLRASPTSPPAAGIPDFLSFNAPSRRSTTRLSPGHARGDRRRQIRDFAYFGAGEVGSEEVPTGSPGIDASDPPAGTGHRKGQGLLTDAGLKAASPSTIWACRSTRNCSRPGRSSVNSSRPSGSPWRSSRWTFGLVRRFVKGDYQITWAYQERTIDPDNFYSLVLRTGGLDQHQRLLQQGPRRADRQSSDRDGQGRSARTCTRRSARS